MRGVSDLDLERFLVDDLDPQDAARVAAAINDDPELAAHVASRRAEQRAFAAVRPRLPARVAIDDRRGSFAQRLRVLLAPAALATACVVAFMVLPRSPSDDVTARGAALPVALVVQREGRVFRHAQSVPLRADDRVRIEVTSARDGVGTVVGIDERGAVSLLYGAASVTRGVTIFPDSLALDDSVGPETWIVVVDDVPHDARRVAAAFLSSSGLAAQFPGASIGVVRFEKEGSP